MLPGSGTVWTLLNARQQKLDSGASPTEVLEPDELGDHSPGSDYLKRNRAAWERWSPGHIASGRSAWQSDELRWGLWGTPESQLGLLEGFGPGEDVVELGSGNGSVSAWFARREMRPVAVDFVEAQIRTTESFQKEFGIWFPTVFANAEEVPYDRESFMLAVSEYGASLWCDPRRWLQEAHRLLRPEGRLVFFTLSPILMSCTPADGSQPLDRLVRDYFAGLRVEFEPAGPVEFHLTHGYWIRLLRSIGFIIDDLVEARPHPTSSPRYDLVSSEWAQRWPSEDIWIAHRA